MRLRPFSVLLAATAVTLAACGTEATISADRVVSLSTTACGDASSTSGAGVITEDGWVLASAHVVSGAGSVEVVGPFGTEAAEIIVFDPVADLSLLRVESAQAVTVETSSAATGDEVGLAGGGPSDPLSATILRPVEVRIEAVRSQERISRIGYEIDVRVELGDSGGGVFDADDKLIGVVFGRTGEDEARSFIVGSAAIEGVLSADRSGLWECDPAQHQIVATNP